LSDKETTVKLQEAVRRSYPAIEYAMFYEVSNGTGLAGGSNYADIVAMGLWPSRGLNVLGFELKASRGDWLREKAKPEKSVAIQRYCDLWYLVTAKGVVLDQAEIPENWGWLELVGTRLYTRKKAPKLKAEPLTREFTAAVLRRAGQVTEEAVSVRVATALAEARAKDAVAVEREIARRSSDNAKAIEAIEAFEAASGIQIPLYAGGNVGEAFAAFQRLCQSTSGWDGLEAMARSCERVLEAIRATHAELAAIVAAEPQEA
jgi:hypothetical protein